MRRIFKLLALVALLMLVGVNMTSCGGYSNDKAKEMIKLDDTGKLDEGDYTDMVKWVKKARTKYLDEWEDIIKDKKNYMDYYLAKQELDARFGHEYVFLKDISIILDSAGEKKMGKENFEDYEKFQARADDRQSKLALKAPKAQ